MRKQAAEEIGELADLLTGARKRKTP